MCVSNKGNIYIQQWKDGTRDVGSCIRISPIGGFAVGEVYADARNELRDRCTFYSTDGTTFISGYDVAIAQTELGVADFSTEEQNNDTDAIVHEFGKPAIQPIANAPAFNQNVKALPLNP